uniref:Uncharacterized protein n=1 Tax=Vespula pensylvanica TaxID=30213 RepID=A0A834NWW7_VESPE|nr:hypothetical protein H0235_010429 [Vespula pensylvanica]
MKSVHISLSKKTHVGCWRLLILFLGNYETLLNFTTANNPSRGATTTTKEAATLSRQVSEHSHECYRDDARKQQNNSAGSVSTSRTTESGSRYGSYLAVWRIASGSFQI